MSTNGKPKLEGCAVLEPMESGAPTHATSEQGTSKRKQNNRKAANRFADLKVVSRGRCCLIFSTICA